MSTKKLSLLTSVISNAELSPHRPLELARGGDAAEAAAEHHDAHIPSRVAWSPRIANTDLSEKRFPLFDDIGGRLRSFPVADVLRRVNRAGRDEEDVARLQRHWCLSFHRVLERRPFENIDNLVTGMRVPGGRNPGVELDDRLHDLASWDAEIVPLEIDASGSCLLGPRHVKNQTAREMTAATTAIRLARMSPSCLLPHIREKPFVTRTPSCLNPYVTIHEESNLLDDRIVGAWIVLPGLAALDDFRKLAHP